jgi:hypothetical protein
MVKVQVSGSMTGTGPLLRMKNRSLGTISAPSGSISCSGMPKLPPPYGVKRGSLPSAASVASGSRARSSAAARLSSMTVTEHSSWLSR